MALAIGAKTYKLTFWPSLTNQPCIGYITQTLLFDVAKSWLCGR